MKKVNVKIKGVAPLLQHRFPLEEHGQNKSKSKKKVYDPKEEADKALYKNKKGIYEPSEHVWGAMIKASTKFKFEGKKTYKDIIKGGIVVEPDAIPLNRKDYDEIDARAVVVQRSRVVRWRPKFNKWELSFDILILDDDNLAPSTLKEILEEAGKVGIGDFRPRFGRFQVTHFEEVKT